MSRLRRLFSRDLSLVWVTNILMLAGYTFHSALLPLYMDQAGLSDGVIGFIMGITMPGSLLALALMGAAIDRLDRRIFLVGGALLWAITSLVIAQTTAVAWLAACRLLQGFGFAIFSTATLVYASAEVADDLRGSVVGMIEAVGATAIAVTPPLALWICTAFDYRAGFGSAAVLSLAAAAAGLWLARQPSSLPQGISKVPFKLFNRSALLPGLLGGALAFAASGYVSMAPLIAVRLNIPLVGLYLGVRALATVPTRLAAGVIADRRGLAWAIIPGFLVAVIALAGLPLLTQPGWVWLAPVCFGLGMGLASPGLITWMLKRAAASERAIAANTYAMIAEFIGFSGTWFLGISMESGTLNGIYLLAFVMALGLLGYVILHRSGLFGKI
jgi:MFS family permease